jgi:hypothetical protein
MIILICINQEAIRVFVVQFIYDASILSLLEYVVTIRSMLTTVFISTIFSCNYILDHSICMFHS